MKTATKLSERALKLAIAALESGDEKMAEKLFARAADLESQGR